MVSFEEMIRALDLKNVLLRFLMKVAHPFLKKNFKIDMDELQAWVFKNVPEPTLMTSVATIVISAMVWQLVFWVLHYAMIPAFMNAFKKNPAIKHWQVMDERAKQWYTS